jgi:hypothetical protein
MRGLRARAGGWAAAAALAALIGGCSGTANQSVPSFSTDYSSASQHYRTDLAALQASARTAIQQGPAAEVDVFRQLVTVTQSALDRFDALHPSQDAAADVNDLRDSLREQLKSLRSAVSALSGSDAGALNAALASYADEVQQGLSLQHRLDSSIQVRGP